MKKEVVAMLLAGGQGSRLYALTSQVAKPAVPFGGKYRIIDFPPVQLCQLRHRHGGRAHPYRPLELNSYLGNGQPWDLGPVRRRRPHPAPLHAGGGTRAPGTRAPPTPSIRTSASWTCMTPTMWSSCPATTSTRWTTPTWWPSTRRPRPACTISVLEVTLEEATRFGIMNAHPDGQVYEFEEKPKHPQEHPGLHGHLRVHLVQAPGVPHRRRGRSQLLQRLRQEHHSQHARRRREADDLPLLRLLEGRGHHRLPCGTPTWTCWLPRSRHQPVRPQLAHLRPAPPIKAAPTSPAPNAVVSHSLVTGGSQVDGRVENSVLFHSVTVEEGAPCGVLHPHARRRSESGGHPCPTPSWRKTQWWRRTPGWARPPNADPQVGIAVVASGVTIGEKATVSPQRHDPYRRERR